MKILFLIFAILAIKVFGDICEEGEKQKLTKGLYMKCIDGEWVKVEKRKSGPGGPPCTDDPSKSCSADQGHCSQYTVKGAEMDRDCPGTCESCDGCRCQDDSQWHKYCPFWKQFCGSAGVLGNWMTTNCKKTCGECKCKCCSYQGKQHKLGATIQLPEKCGQLICEESMVAGYSPLLPGATAHNVTHPEELTLNFYSVHGGADCCILPGTARSADGSSVANGTMVAEGWSGELSIRRGMFPTTCCHGVLCLPLGDASELPNPTTTTATTAATTTSANGECSNDAKMLSVAPPVAGFESSKMVICDDPTNRICERDIQTLCPVGFHLCTYLEFWSLNDNWSGVVDTSHRPVGEIYCRGSGGHAGHFTLGYGGNALSMDIRKNAMFGSSRPECNKSYNVHDCDEKHVTALCCSANPKCGDGVVQAPLEECDDGNSSNDDDCLNSCTFRVA